MAIISSHILDSVHGCSASGIRVQCQKMVNRNGDQIVFEVEANEEGRIMEEVSFEESGEPVSYTHLTLPTITEV